MKVKLIIWDLDDTLWSGTLAEGDNLEIFKSRIDILKRLNKHGIVNSICSKNNFQDAKTTLQSLDLWDEFVFPRIEFSSKGPIVKWIIENMQLRAENTVFIDDNAMNLKEVEHYSPGIKVLDATQGSTDAFLEKVLMDNSHISKSRIQEYRILEKKMSDYSNSSSESTEDFLRTCGIKLTLIRRAENLPFRDRIEEIINRTNQLNFTKNRIQEGEITDYILDVDNNDTYSVFVWDNYGIYGLAGFISIEKKTRCTHFLFSCRTMNMGIEQFLYQRMKIDSYLQIQHLAESHVDWITVVQKDDPEFIEVLDKMGKSREIDMHIMANCQSGIISHYLSKSDRAHIDNWPNVFTLSQQNEAHFTLHPDAKYLVYGAFNDYSNQYWEQPPTDEKFSQIVSSVFQEWSDESDAVFLILPPQEIPSHKLRPDLGVDQVRVSAWNDIISKTSERFGFYCLFVDDYVVEENDVIDIRHYERVVFERISMMIDSIIEEISSQSENGN